MTRPACSAASAMREDSLALPGMTQGLGVLQPVSGSGHALPTTPSRLGSAATLLLLYATSEKDGPPDLRVAEEQPPGVPT